MIAFLEGLLVEKQPTLAVIDVGGVGFAVHIPLSSYHALGGLKSRVRVETHLHVREDAIQLFGFATRDEKQLFELLLGVSGVGPRLALSVLSGTSVADFTSAILMEDVKKLSSISGVGKKTAQRLVMELRDTLGKAGIEPGAGLPLAAAPEERGVVDDAVLGLVSLGYDRAEARRAIARVSTDMDGTPTAEELIRRVLQQGA